MGRGKSLSEYEKGQIVAYHNQGLSNRKIAGRVGRSLNVVNLFLNDPVNYGTRKSPGRPSKVSERDKRQIIRKASNSVVSCSTIKKDLELEVSAETVRRVIHKNPNIRRRRLRKGPAIRKENRKKRVEFGQRNTRKDWSMVSYFKGFLIGPKITV